MGCRACVGAIAGPLVTSAAAGQSSKSNDLLDHGGPISDTGLAAPVELPCGEEVLRAHRIAGLRARPAQWLSSQWTMEPLSHETVTLGRKLNGPCHSRNPRKY